MKFDGVQYCKQINGYDCVPCAITNSIKWAGIPISYKKSRKRLEKIFKLEKGKGVSTQDVFNALDGQELPFKIKKITFRSKYSTVQKHLDKGGAVIFSFLTGANSAHVVFVHKNYDKDHMHVVNYFGHTTHTIVAKTYMEVHLSNSSFLIFIEKLS